MSLDHESGVITVRSTEAEQRLIAAAPDLLAALQGLVGCILDYERVNNLAPNPGRKYCWDATARAIAAIEKATGVEIIDDPVVEAVELRSLLIRDKP